MRMASFIQELLVGVPRALEEVATWGVDPMAWAMGGVLVMDVARCSVVDMMVGVGEVLDAALGREATQML
jgi:hypothetical protein